MQGPSTERLLIFCPDNQGNDSRRGAGLVLINAVGQCGPVLGTRLYPKSEGTRYAKGMSICAAFMFFAATVSLALRFLLTWENRRLNRRYGSIADSKHGTKEVSKVNGGDGAVGEEDYGPSFRYVL